jgi:SNF2 family DNA or RNA helicase
VTYYSGNSPQQNEEAKKVFLDMGNNITYLIATPASAGTGQNLQGPDRHVIYYSHTDNAIDFWQSRDRTHRIGVDYSVPYTYIIGIGSEDRKVMRRTLKKESIHNMATQDFKGWLEENNETPLTDLFEVGQPSEDDEMRNALNHGDL